jgi:hypothetical protein
MAAGGTVRGVGAKGIDVTDPTAYLWLAITNSNGKSPGELPVSYSN